MPGPVAKELKSGPVLAYSPHPYRVFSAVLPRRHHFPEVTWHAEAPCFIGLNSLVMRVGICIGSELGATSLSPFLRDVAPWTIIVEV
jgi:hypothetical protein